MKRLLKSIGLMLFAFLFAFLFAECTRMVYTPQTRTEFVNRERVDSLLVHDSIFVTEKIKGDTVYLYRDRWHTEYRDRLRVDTIIRIDSIAYPVEVINTEYKTPVIVKPFAVLGLVVFLYLVFRVIRKLYL